MMQSFHNYISHEGKVQQAISDLFFMKDNEKGMHFRVLLAVSRKCSIRHTDLLEGRDL